MILQNLIYFTQSVYFPSKYFEIKFSALDAELVFFSLSL